MNAKAWIVPVCSIFKDLEAPRLCCLRTEKPQFWQFFAVYQLVAVARPKATSRIFRVAPSISFVPNLPVYIKNSVSWGLWNISHLLHPLAMTVQFCGYCSEPNHFIHHSIRLCMLSPAEKAPLRYSIKRVRYLAKWQKYSLEHTWMNLASFDVHLCAEFSGLRLVAKTIRGN